MKQNITITESQLRDMVVRAINENMNEGFFGDMFRGAKQAYSNYRNDAGVQNAKEAQKQAKQTMRTANKTNKQITNASQKDLAYLNNMQQRYGDFNIKQGLNMLIAQIQKAVQSAGQNATNAQNNYNTAQNTTQQAKNTRSQNLINKISGGNQQQPQQQQPQQQPQSFTQSISNPPANQQPQNQAMEEMVDRIVSNYINENLKK